MKVELLASLLLVLYLQIAIPVDAQGLPVCEDNDWDIYRPTKKCFRAVNEQVSWNTANIRCQQMHATLATVHSVFVNNFLLELTYRKGVKEPWIGLKNTNGDLSWVDGSQVDFHSTWWPKHPMKTGNNCVYMTDDRTDNKAGWWLDEDCAADHRASGYICMKEAGISKDNK